MRHGHPHQAYYCEENVWQLALRLGDPDAAVLILSNEAGRFAMWHQRSSPMPELPTVWDYHVVYARPATSGWSVFDLDTRLPFPIPLRAWATESFLPLPPTVELSPPRVRVVRAWRYLSRFASDRSHMHDGQGRWIAPPPPWDPIQPKANTLPRLLDAADPFLGRWCDLEELSQRLESG